MRNCSRSRPRLAISAYRAHLLPHDVEVRELATGHSRKHELVNLLAEPVITVPNHSTDDGITATRGRLGMSWFDEVATRKGLAPKAGGARACLVAFDLLNLNGEDLRQRPLEERRNALSRLVAGLDSVLFSEALAAEGAIGFAKACELGLEGIVSKRTGSRYWSGRSWQWLKSKNPAFLRE